MNDFHPLRLILVFTALFFAYTSVAQYESDLVQISGMVVAEEAGELEPVPFANIAVLNTSRGTFTNMDGFFSIVVRKGETIVVSAIGYESGRYTVPDTLMDKRYTLFQILSRDTSLTLPTAVIYPWPSKDYFSIEFLAMDVSNELSLRAKENLSERYMASLRRGMPADGGETSSHFLRQQARSYYHYGQMPPMNIYNPLAWAEFIRAWREGKFKRELYDD